MSFLAVLTLIFIVLKLVSVITWSWWLVLAPIWVILVLRLLIILAAGGAVAATSRKL